MDPGRPKTPMDSHQNTEHSIPAAMDRLVDRASIADPVDTLQLGLRTMNAGALAIAFVAIGEAVLALTWGDRPLGIHALALLGLALILRKMSTMDDPPLVGAMVLSLGLVAVAGLLLPTGYLIPGAVVFSLLLVSVPVLIDERQAKIFFSIVWVFAAFIFWLWLEDFWVALWLGPVFTGVTWTLSRFISDSHNTLRRSHDANRRILEVVDGSPSPMLLEDFTRLRRTLAAMEAKGIDLEEYLDQDLRRIPELLGQIEVTYANQANASFRDTVPDEFLGSFDAGVINDHNRWAFREQVLAIGRGEKAYTVTYPEFVGSNVRWVEVNWIVPGGAESDFSSVVLVVHDVTEGQAELAALEEETETKDRFVASVAHELRTPLTGLYGLSEILNSEWDSTSEEDKRSMIGMIRDQGLQMTNIVEDLLIAAKADYGALTVRSERVELGEVARAVINSEGANASVVDGVDVFASADTDRVRQITRNLVSNAVRYGGSDIQVRTVLEDGLAVIEVSDDGPGVPPSQRDRIFDAYESAHSKTTMSVGLGLWVARLLAQMMSGDLFYQRVDGRTVFRLTLPASTL